MTQMVNSLQWNKAEYNLMREKVQYKIQFGGAVLFSTCEEHGTVDVFIQDNLMIEVESFPSFFQLTNVPHSLTYCIRFPVTLSLVPR